MSLLTSRTRAARPAGARAVRSPLWNGLLGVFLVILFAAATNTIYESWAEISLHGMDLQQDYIAAQRLVRGHPLYTRFSADEVRALGIDPAAGVGMWSNAHPPLAVLLFVPLTWLSYSSAALIWTIVNAALLVWICLRLIDALDLPIGGLWRWIVPLLVLSWHPVWYNLHCGNIIVPLGALIVEAWIDLRRGADRRAGLWLGLAALIKMYPLLLIGYLAWRRSWRALAVALLTIGVGVALLPGAWLAYVTEGAPANTRAFSADAGNTSLTGLSMRLLHGSPAIAPLIDVPMIEPIVRIALVAALGVALLALLSAARRDDDLTGEYSLLIVAMLLLSPITWHYTYILLLLPFAYVWRCAIDHPTAIGWLPLVLIVAALLIAMLPRELYQAQIEHAALADGRRFPFITSAIVPNGDMALLTLAGLMLTFRRSRCCRIAA